MSGGRVVRPSSVGGTVEWSCEWHVDSSPDVGEVRTKETKIQEVVDELMHPAEMEDFLAG